jgi:thymidylate synthase
MNNLDKKYTDLLQDILDNGTRKMDRTGTGTLSVFGRQIRHKMSDGFPLLTTKKMAWKTMVTELLWFLRGDTNIKYLVDNNCHIWDGDAYKNYLVKTKNQIEDPNDLNWDLTTPKDPKITQFTQEEFINKIKTDDEFAKKFGELGPIYGRQWRNWNAIFDGGVDQIANLINDLKTNPDSRRLMVNAYNVGELDQMVLPPCHYGFQVYTRELGLEERSQYKRGNKETYPVSKWRDDMGVSKEEYFNQIGIPNRAISLMYNCRSQDLPLGTPFNISSYALLLEIIGKMVNMVPDELIANMGDCHIYLNQIDGVKEQLTREPYPLPTLKHMKTDEFYKSLSEDLTLLTHLDNIDFVVENYQSHPTIKMPLSN